MAVWARTVRGLEAVVAGEIEDRLGGRVVQTRHRDVVFEIDTVDDALRLHTADDVYSLAATVEGIGRHRTALAALEQAARSLHAGAATPVLSGRGVAVTASFLGRRNYNRFDIEDAVGQGLARLLGVAYHARRSGSRPPSDVQEWRVHIADETAFIGRRLAAVPLHRRSYKVVSPAGSLHPPVAAAMARLGGLRDGAVMFDPACGAGTIPIEAARWHAGAICIGADIVRSAIAGASTNAAAAGVEVSWQIADAGVMPLADHTVDAVVVNLPWGRQADVAGVLARKGSHSFGVELARVLTEGGVAVVLTEEPITAPSRDLVVIASHEIALSGAHARIDVIARSR